MSPQKVVDPWRGLNLCWSCSAQQIWIAFGSAKTVVDHHTDGGISLSALSHHLEKPAVAAGCHLDSPVSVMSLFSQLPQRKLSTSYPCRPCGRLWTGDLSGCRWICGPTLCGRFCFLSGWFPQTVPATLSRSRPSHAHLQHRDMGHKWSNEKITQLKSAISTKTSINSSVSASDSPTHHSCGATMLFMTHESLRFTIFLQYFARFPPTGLQSGWGLTAPLQIVFFFCHSVVYFLLCSWLLCCYTTHHTWDQSDRWTRIHVQGGVNQMHFSVFVLLCAKKAVHMWFVKGLNCKNISIPLVYLLKKT